MIAGNPHIFFHSGLDSPEEWRNALAAQLGDFTFSVAGDSHEPASVDAALVWTLPDQGFDAFVNLKAILSLGAGINQLDHTRLPPKVPIARLVDPSLTQTMIEYAIAAVYRYHRRFHYFEANSRESIWAFEPPKLARETSVGILGLGELGGEIALALRQLGFDVRGWSRSQKSLQGFKTYSGNDGLIDMLQASGIVVNVLPLTPVTHGILCSDLFEKFRPGTCLINMGRGLHLVEADLLEAIEAGKVAAATLDVTSVEPLPTVHPFWNHRDILITPHVAGMSTPMSAAAPVAENVRRAIAGKVLLNQVDLARGY